MQALAFLEKNLPYLSRICCAEQGPATNVNRRIEFYLRLDFRYETPFSHERTIQKSLVQPKPVLSSQCKHNRSFVPHTNPKIPLRGRSRRPL